MNQDPQSLQPNTHHRAKSPTPLQISTNHYDVSGYDTRMMPNRRDPAGQTRRSNESRRDQQSPPLDSRQQPHGRPSNEYRRSPHTASPDPYGPPSGEYRRSPHPSSPDPYGRPSGEYRRSPHSPSPDSYGRPSNEYRRGPDAGYRRDYVQQDPYGHGNQRSTSPRDPAYYGQSQAETHDPYMRYDRPPLKQDPQQRQMKPQMVQQRPNHGMAGSAYQSEQQHQIDMQQHPNHNRNVRDQESQRQQQIPQGQPPPPQQQQHHRQQLNADVRGQQWQPDDGYRQQHNQVNAYMDVGRNAEREQQPVQQQHMYARQPQQMEHRNRLEGDGWRQHQQVRRDQHVADQLHQQQAPIPQQVGERQNLEQSFSAPPYAQQPHHRQDGMQQIQPSYRRHQEEHQLGSSDGGGGANSKVEGNNSVIRINDSRDETTQHEASIPAHEPEFERDGTVDIDADWLDAYAKLRDSVVSVGSESPVDPLSNQQTSSPPPPISTISPKSQTSSASPISPSSPRYYLHHQTSQPSPLQQEVSVYTDEESDGEHDHDHHPPHLQFQETDEHDHHSTDDVVVITDDCEDYHSSHQSPAIDPDVIDRRMSVMAAEAVASGQVQDEEVEIPDPNRPRCAFCEEYIDGKSVHMLGRFWHFEHSRCKECNRPIGVDNFAEIDGFLYCEDHYVEIRGEYRVRKGQKKQRDSIQQIKSLHTVRRVRNLLNFEKTSRLNILTLEDLKTKERRRFVTSFVLSPDGTTSGSILPPNAAAVLAALPAGSVAVDDEEGSGTGRSSRAAIFSQLPPARTSPDPDIAAAAENAAAAKHVSMML
ncbi:Transforming growth factor beta-1-induced transcript 1 protein [Quaeritorhiza haematococci]|nr:Transforming growth factor beta-1-induced transcript 1 protein [Quaeritorhiza haematococci]